MVQSENRGSWEWFFRNLQQSLPEKIHEPCTSIGEREKGLLEAEAVFGPWGPSAPISPRNLVGNLPLISSAALVLLHKRLLIKLSRHCMSSERMRRHGLMPLITKNGQLSLALAATTAMTPQKLFRVSSEYDLVMVKRAELLATARHSVEKGLVKTPYLESKQRTQLEYSREKPALPSCPTVVRLMKGGGRNHIVDLAKRSCTCGRWQETKTPCGYVITVIKRLPGKGSDLCPCLLASFTTATWATAYATTLAPVIDDLTIAENCQPPATSISCGWPRKERFHKENSRVLEGEETESKLAWSHLWQLMSIEYLRRASRCRQPYD